MNSQKKEAFNMKRIQLTLIALFAAVAGLVAQNAYEGVISYKISLDKTGNKVLLNGAADMSNLKLKSTQMIIVTPILRSEDGTSNRRNAVTCNTLHLVECANQLGKSFVRALPEIADIYSGQYDLFPAFACYLFGLRDKVGDLAIPAASARKRNRAKRAEIVASVDSALGMGGAVIFVITVASLVCSSIYHFILSPFGLTYLNTIVFIMVIAMLVTTDRRASCRERV